MLRKTNKKTKEGRDIYIDGNREVALPRVTEKHQSKLPGYVYGSFRTPQLKGDKDTRRIVVKPIKKIEINGDKFIVYQ